MADFNLIFEGCDCVGKTSVINEILKIDPTFKVIKGSAPESEDVGERDCKACVAAMDVGTGIIFDRGPLGECVYAPIYRNYYPNYMRELEYSIPPHNFLILLTAMESTIYRRFDGIFIKKSDIPTILKAYENEFMACNYKHKLMFSTDHVEPEELAARILRIVRKMFNYNICQGGGND